MKAATWRCCPPTPHPIKTPKSLRTNLPTTFGSSGFLRGLRFPLTQQANKRYLTFLQDLTIEDFFSEDSETSPNEKRIPLLEQALNPPITMMHSAKQRPFKNPEAAKQEEYSQAKSPSQSSLSSEEQVLIQNSSLSDEYIMDKIIQQSRPKVEQREQAGRVFIFPTLQLNMVGYREDEELFIKMLQFYSKQENQLSKIRLATGYFNLQKELQDILVKNPALKTDILTSSPRANGFYRAGRFKKFIPGMYRVNELKMLKEQKSKGYDHIAIFEYENGEWTYHAKGAWIYEESQPDVPQMTVLGSSNYSRRSNRRDTECQLYIVSECEEFKQRMHEECLHIYQKTNKMSIETVKDDGTDKLNWKDKLFNRIFGFYL